MRYAELSGRDMVRVLSLQRRRFPWGTFYGWLVLIGAGIGWGVVVAKALIEFMGPVR